jgi:hypothetical protein
LKDVKNVSCQKDSRYRIYYIRSNFQVVSQVIESSDIMV